MKKMKKEGCIEKQPRSEARFEYGRVQQENQQLQRTVEKREQDIGSYYWHGIDPRRKQEYADGGMVAEDRNAMANLSEQGYQAQYPKVAFYGSPNIDRLEVD